MLILYVKWQAYEVHEVRHSVTHRLAYNSLP